MLEMIAQAAILSGRRASEMDLPCKPVSPGACAADMLLRVPKFGSA